MNFYDMNEINSPTNKKNEVLEGVDLACHCLPDSEFWIGGIFMRWRLTCASLLISCSDYEFI